MASELCATNPGFVPKPIVNAASTAAASTESLTSPFGYAHAAGVGIAWASSSRRDCLSSSSADLYPSNVRRVCEWACEPMVTRPIWDIHCTWSHDMKRSAPCARHPGIPSNADSKRQIKSNAAVWDCDLQEVTTLRAVCRDPFAHVRECLSMPMSVKMESAIGSCAAARDRSRVSLSCQNVSLVPMYRVATKKMAGTECFCRSG